MTSGRDSTFHPPQAGHFLLRTEGADYFWQPIVMSDTRGGTIRPGGNDLTLYGLATALHSPCVHVSFSGQLNDEITLREMRESTLFEFFFFIYYVF